MSGSWSEHIVAWVRRDAAFAVHQGLFPAEFRGQVLHVLCVAPVHEIELLTTNGTIGDGQITAASPMRLPRRFGRRLALNLSACKS